MAKTNSKERRSQLASELRRSGQQDAFSIKELVSLLVDEAKDILVKEQAPNDMLRCQGAVQALVKLHNMLTIEPPSIKEGDKQ